MGGSALPSSSPTIGLLFGYQQNLTITIIDAEEVETSANPTTLSDEQTNHIRTKIELHQKVFPTHEVMGWYKVSKSNNIDGSGDDGILPTAQDLKIHNGWMRDFNENPLYVLMDASDKKVDSASSSNTDGEEAREKLDRDEELPFTVYESMTTTSGSTSASEEKTSQKSIFVNLDFDLDTFEPERIAIEKVFKTQPSRAAMSATTVASAAASEKSKSAPDTDMKRSSEDPTTASAAAVAPILPPPQPTAAEIHIQSAIESIDAMNARVAILLDFLRKTQNKTIPTNQPLLRQVMSLVKQLPLVTGRKGDVGNRGGEEQKHARFLSEEIENEYDGMLVMTYLATLAKTTKAVLGYSEKFGVVVESNGSRRGGDFIGTGMFREWSTKGETGTAVGR